MLASSSSEFADGNGDGDERLLSPVLSLPMVGKAESMSEQLAAAVRRGFLILGFVEFLTVLW